MGDLSIDFISKVRDFASGQNLFAVENIIVGVSGGPDSMALISVLKELSLRMEKFPNIYAVHVNHGIRPGDADRDQKFVEDYCKEKGITLKSFYFDVPELSKKAGKSLEEMGRICRYKAFEEYSTEIAEENASSTYAIAVAHHRDDMSETMLMNLFRGCGLDGLVSLRGKSGNIIRPFLCVSKDEILEYLKLEDISFVNDYTNNELDCTRNIWRNKVIPVISEVSIKEPHSALGDTYSLLKDDSDFIEDYANRVYEENVLKVNGGELLPCKVINNLPKAISSRLIRKLRLVNFGNLVDFGTVNLDLVLKLSKEATNETRIIDMPFDSCAFVMSGYLGFGVNRDLVPSISRGVANSMGVLTSLDHVRVEMNPQTENTAKIPHSHLQIRTQKFENIDGLEYNKTSWFVPVYGDEPDKVIVANGLTSMKFTKAGSNAGKMLGKVMSDMHIPKDARGFVLGVMYGEDYLWIPGIGHSNGFVDLKSFEAWSKGNSIPTGYMQIEIIGG